MLCRRRPSHGLRMKLAPRVELIRIYNSPYGGGLGV